MFSQTTLIGRVGRDPEIRSMQNGGRVASFSLVTDRKWKDKQSGEQKERSEWHRIVVFNEHLVSVVEDYVSKGMMLLVVGANQTRKWTDQSGQEKFSTEVVLQSFGGEIKILSTKSGKTSNASRQQELPDLDDEIPF